MPSNNIDALLSQPRPHPVQPTIDKSPVEDTVLAPVKADDVALENPHAESNIVDISTAKTDIQQKPVEISPKLEEKPQLESEFDDYGNEKPKKESKLYSEDEVNERINKAVRERLERLERNSNTNLQPHTQPNLQPTGLPGENPTTDDWQKQFEEMTFKALEKREAIRREQEIQQRELRAQQEFEAKFRAGMNNFQDYVEVVSSQPISDAMTVATRGMKDPAAFLYAASKRHSDELQRICQIPDAYTQMVEIGRLEERMRKTQSPTSAPKPIRPTREDSIMEEPERQPVTIDEMIQAADRARLARIRR